MGERKGSDLEIYLPDCMSVCTQQKSVAVENKVNSKKIDYQIASGLVLDDRPYLYW